MSSEKEARLEWIALAAFFVLTAALAANHVMWRDEVRALSVAIHAASWSALPGNLHTEGHPILWYALLRAGYAVTHSVYVMPVLSIVIGVVAAYLVLHFAPFPLWSRLIIVFGVFLSYEFSVLARNYGLGVLFMIVSCILFPRRLDHPLPLATSLAMMANTSVHAAIAAVVLTLVWASDAFSPTRRKAMMSGWSIIGFATVATGVAVGLITAKLRPDMAFGPDLSLGHFRAVLPRLIADPGLSLAGTDYSDVAGAGTLPWAKIHIDPAVASRVLVDISLACIGWSLRKNKRCLIAMIAAIVLFSVLFRVAYSGALRHEGVVAFLLISLCWIAANEESGSDRTSRRRIAFGLLPLLSLQAIALPFLVRRVLVHPESSSKAFGALIHRTPRYRDAILMSEPDYMMESMPYYVTNPIFMPRQREFTYDVYFDRTRRQQHLTLGELVRIADNVSCHHRRVVLLAIAYSNVFADSVGVTTPAYRGADFVWSPGDKRILFSRAHQIVSFDNAIEENYRVFEVNPENPWCESVDFAP